MEEWKDVIGYEGLYQVSNNGQVRSRHSGIWKTMKQNTRKGGYKKLFLRKNKSRKGLFVHRLVALAFIPNPDNLPFINHKDENPSNNNVENLEWCTHLYNMTYGTCQERNVGMQGKGNMKKETSKADLTLVKKFFLSLKPLK